MPGMLESLGQGLQDAGAVLSPEVNQMQATERQNKLVNVARGLEIQKAQRSLAADQKFQDAVKDLKPGMTSSAMLESISKVDPGVLAESPAAQHFLTLTSQVHSREAAAEAKKEQMVLRHEQLERQSEADRMRSEDRNLGIQERAAADRRHEALQRELAKSREEATKMNIDLRRELGGLPPRGEPGAAPKADPNASPAAGTEAATYDYLIKGSHPPVRGGVYQAVMRNVERIAKDNNMTTQQLISASADVKTRLMAKKTFETRVQNLGRAENQLELEIPVMEDAMKNLDLPSIPAAARGKIFLLRQMGNPDVVKLDQAAEVVFNEFNGIVTGNPGTLNVQDVVNAKEQYKHAQTPEQMKAVIGGMRRIITNAKQANDKTRKEIMGGVSDALAGKEGGDAGHDPSARPQTPVAKVMKFDSQGNLIQ